ncbi:G2/mitotic-specific cyclin-B-like [Physella acuta]|uniref:G2/mitotic-specific cyclin-B-like n=1 Tax=Physella acuta TaxID=109671 RepID=UPI0027DD9CFF|nr:G2/mitotic-specific cyclin-B-like [Physella acuta]
MAANVGVTTRLRAKKARELLGRHGNAATGSNLSRRKSKDVLANIDEENAELGACGAAYNRRSFPLEHESDAWSRENDKTSKTESTAKQFKQRRTLSERGENTARYPPLVGRQQSHRPLDQVTPAKSGRQKNVEDRQIYQTDFNSLQVTMSTPVGVSAFPMDTDMVSVCALAGDRRQLPEGVSDIDQCPDSLSTTVYSKEIMEYLMHMETRGVLEPGFLNNSPDVTSRMRGVLMDWLLQVQNHEELKDDTLHMCVDLIDRFLSIINVKMPKLQLVGITSLLIASKFSERFAPEITTLCYLTDNTYVKDQVLSYERYILQTLRFDLTRPVCVTFLDRYLQVHQHPKEVEYQARYVLDLSVSSIHMVPVLPSLKAASALFLARRIWLDTVVTWTPDLEFYTSYTGEDLQDTVTELAIILVKAPSSKFQGARNKYNTEEHLFISRYDHVRAQMIAKMAC